jgi:hypothetical protein
MLAIGTKTNQDEDNDYSPDCNSTSKPPIRLENSQNRHPRHEQKRIYMRRREEVHLQQNEPAERKGRRGIGAALGGQIYETKQTKRGQ